MNVETVTGKGILPHLDAIASLRMRVFREFPYLYDGDLAYEKDYLRVYADCPESCVVLALDGSAKEVIGASTGLPLAAADEDFSRAFDGSEWVTNDIFYFGESVLLPGHRGKGIGHAFFDGRETHARRLGFSVTTFCAIERPADDPRRPSDYRQLDGFWQRRGYEHHAELKASFAWNEIGRGETKNTLSFWLRQW